MRKIARYVDFLPASLVKEEKAGTAIISDRNSITSTLSIFKEGIPDPEALREISVFDVLEYQENYIYTIQHILHRRATSTREYKLNDDLIQLGFLPVFYLPDLILKILESVSTHDRSMLSEIASYAIGRLENAGLPEKHILKYNHTRSLVTRQKEKGMLTSPELWVNKMALSKALDKDPLVITYGDISPILKEGRAGNLDKFKITDFKTTQEFDASVLYEDSEEV